MSMALDILIFATGYTYILLAPYAKVEESFNLHATHDVFMYGVSKSNLHKVSRMLVRPLNTVNL
jgi:alpha-1,6-mannosyltransferase